MDKAKSLTVNGFRAKKNRGEKISMVTCYDFWTAQILNSTSIDSLLVGDSLAMVMHGFDSTVHADIELMALHTKAVRKGAPNKFLIGDMPFLALRKGLAPAMEAVQVLMQAGCNAIKLEGEAGQAELIKHIVESGVPVMGHLGLTPQSVNSFGGHKVQGRGKIEEEKIIESATLLAGAGCFSLVLECIPATLAAKITRAIEIPTIGIGAGSETDGQVLVLQDMLGMNPDFKPKFLRHYAQGHSLVTEAVNKFHEETSLGCFPSKSESYS